MSDPQARDGGSLPLRQLPVEQVEEAEGDPGFFHRRPAHRLLTFCPYPSDRPRQVRLNSRPDSVTAIARTQAIAVKYGKQVRQLLRVKLDVVRDLRKFLVLYQPLAEALQSSKVTLKRQLCRPQLPRVICHAGAVSCAPTRL